MEIGSIVVSPDEPDVLFATTGTLVWESPDGGNTWTGLTNPSAQGRIPFVKTNQRAGANFDLWFGDVSLNQATCTTPAGGGSAPRCPPNSWVTTGDRSNGAHADMGDVAFDPQAADDACPLLISSDGGVYLNTITKSPDCHTADAGSNRPRPRTGLVPAINELTNVMLRRSRRRHLDIVTGGGQDFVRVYSERVYGIPPEQVVGTAGGTKYSYDKDGKPILTKEPKLLLNDNNAGKPEGIHLMIGRRPVAAFGNSTGDRQMLEYTRCGRRPAAGHAGASRRRRARIRLRAGPGSPRHQGGRFTQDLYDEAKKDGWVVMSVADVHCERGFRPLCAKSGRRKHVNGMLVVLHWVLCRSIA